LFVTLKYTNIGINFGFAITSSFALVKKALDSLGAKITVTNRTGEGTTFTVRLKTAKIA
jgi:C4-dicarboxylate-specific signal transduction histidine kinase